MAIFLNSGLLKSPTCTVGDYRIDWRLGSLEGDIVFISGKGSDPELQAQHPLVNEVVSSGTLFPVINYVIINGIRTTSAYEIGSEFSPGLKECMPFQIIDPINCSTVLGTNKLYKFDLTYNNTTENVQNKNRTFSFNISPTTKYIAWEMVASTIADGLKFYYCTPLDPSGVLIDNYIVGTQQTTGVNVIENLSPIDYPLNPRVKNSNNFKYVTNLTTFTYATGNWVRVEIIGSVYDPTNNNTNWGLKLNCLDNFDTDFGNIDISKFNAAISPTISFEGPSTCAYTFKYNTQESAENTNNPTSCDILNYLNIRVSSTTNGSGTIGNASMNGDEVETKNPYNTKYSFLTYSGVTCQNLPSGETISTKKIPGLFTITFSSSIDYNNAVNEISQIQSSLAYTNYLTAPVTDPAYYNAYNFLFAFAESCGDTITSQWLLIHFSSVITYNAGTKVITLTCPTISNMIDPIVDCNSPYTAVTSQLYYINSAADSTHNLQVSKIVNNYYARAASLYIQNDFKNVITREMYYIITKDDYIDLLDDVIMINNGFCVQSGTWVKHKCNDRIIFTNPSTHESRLANWTLERQKRMRTGLCSDTFIEANWELVYTKTL